MDQQLLSVQWSSGPGHCAGQKERCSGDRGSSANLETLVLGDHEGTINVVNNKIEILLHQPD